eukprot:RCo019053
MDLCYLEVPRKKLRRKNLSVGSDICEFTEHPDPWSWNVRHTFHFPLGGVGPFLCTQGIGGQFTHFLPQTFHAVDLECDVGTPVLSVGEGVVVEVRQEHQATGIHVDNLYLWNSITVALDVGVWVDFVHVMQGSAAVRVGEKVRPGQVLCLSGDVGFCPR